MTDCAHVILTRFNVPTPGREAEVRNRQGWLDRRFTLFEQFCLPSVAAQTVRTFRWIIYFDAQTPQPFRDRIEAAQRVFPFIAHFREALPLDDVRADVRALLGPDQNRVLTTRLDNDDALACNFVARLHKACDFQISGTALNFPHGFAWRDGWVYAAQDESGPFASALESRADFQTIWVRPHALLREAFRLVQLDDAPAWVQVIHGDNVTNRIKGRQRSARYLGQDFALHPAVQAREPSRADQLVEALIRYPCRQVREAGVRLAKPFLRVVR